ncbi:hypothetical protein H2277_08410 [Campylobacter sp. W0014]|uniref:hypothetical protein n=1 Tax=Campylobacter sp. W0014 TaxID=2735781 RepID=UPI001EBF1BA2|nr:hypothetical protein [Campylobacter sp. W0014]
MPIKITNLSYEEFYNKLFSLLRLVEEVRTKMYADSADAPKITIDCTLAETLRAHTNKDEISRLGWGGGKLYLSKIMA